MNLLESLKIVDTGRGISDCPHSQVVHVCHQGPAMLEGDFLTSLEEAVLVSRLLVRAGETQVITNILLSALQIAKLVHVVLYYLIYYTVHFV